jgi:hypothetical protein
MLPPWTNYTSYAVSTELQFNEYKGIPMSQFSHLPLQRALYEVLRADTALMALVTGVWDRVVRETAFPYVSFGNFTGKDWSSNTTKGMEHMVELHIWSRQGGRKQSSCIMERIYTLLHDVNLSVEDHTMVLMRLTSSAICLESDGSTYKGVMRFRVLLESNS